MIPSPQAQLKGHGTSLLVEIMAGITTFMSLTYIFVVNPVILSQSGMPSGAAVFSSIVISGFATVLMGLYARLPFAVAPGLEMNGFFTFVVCGAMGFAWTEALSAVFLAGVLCLIVGFSPLRIHLVQSMPEGLKHNLTITVGVFVALTGFQIANLFEMNGGIIDPDSLSLSAFASTRAVLLYIGFGLSVVLSDRRLNIPGGLLIATILTAILSIAVGIESTGVQFAGRTLGEDLADSLAIVRQVDWLGAVKSPTLLMAALIFAFLQIFGGIGKYISLTASYGLKLDATDSRLARAIQVDGFGTVVGATTGTSSLITFVESAVGIAAGGRTGVVAVVCGLLMFLCLFFRDLASLIPIEATSGVLVFVLYLILKGTIARSGELENSWFDVAVGTVMALAGLMTFSLAVPMCVGFLAYSVQWLVRKKRPNWVLSLSGLAMLAVIIFQHFAATAQANG